jgi:diguanylate cyclase (GGDEF)-like protein
MPVLLLDFDSLKVLKANGAAEQFFENIESLEIDSLVSESERRGYEQFIRKIKRSYYSISFEISPLIKQKQKYLRLDACKIELNEDKTIIQMIINDQTELIEAKKKVEELSITDEMTGLYNHRYFKHNLQKELERAQRHKEDLTLLLFDVDKFKHYNDTNGHPQGDKLLSELGLMIKNTVRDTDIACRYGGEEFAIICPHTKAQDAFILAERLREKIQNHPFNHREKQPLGFVSVSIGISSLEHNISSMEDFKEKVDLALYDAKHRGRNQSVIFYPELLKKAS